VSEGSNSCGVSAQSTVDAQDGAPSPKPVLRENTREQHARELFGLPPEWEWNRMQRLGPFDGKRNGTATLIEGAVCSVRYTRGPRKGAANWAKRDRSTDFICTITDAQHEAWLAQWERDEGRCHECAGSGDTFASWSKAEGRKTKPCRRCNGTGQPPSRDGGGTPSTTDESHDPAGTQSLVSPDEIPGKET